MSRREEGTVTFLAGTARVQVVGFLLVPGVGASPVHMPLVARSFCTSGPLHSNLQFGDAVGLMSTKLVGKTEAGGRGLELQSCLEAAFANGTCWGCWQGEEGFF